MASKLLLLASAILSATAAPNAIPIRHERRLAAGQCTDILIPVQASANNRVVLAPTSDLTTISGVTSFLGSGIGALMQLTSFIPESGTYNISGRYCAPPTGGSIPPERSSHVQLLLHGIPYDKSYWEGLNYAPTGDANNWIAYANAAGYPTLAIDNLGSGQSTRADPVLVVQQALETVILQQLISRLRTGSVHPAIPKAEKVIFVGHSIGAVTGNGVATKYPNAAFDAGILTGYTYTVAQAALGLLTDEIVPASVQNPARFGDLPPAYLTFASVDGKRNTYYGADGTFDAGYPAFDVGEKQGTLTVGELISILSGLEAARGFKGDIFVLTGNEDALFCSVGTREFAKPNCGNDTDNLLAKSQSFWPDARSYEYFKVPGAGHSVTLHSSAQEQFEKVHSYLARQGY